MSDPSKTGASEEDLRTWGARDDALRARARELAIKLGRDEEGIYRTLKNLPAKPERPLAAWIEACPTPP